MQDEEGEGLAVIWHIHNFNISNPQTANIEVQHERDLDEENNQSGLCNVLVGGDWNFLPKGKLPMFLQKPVCANGAVEAAERDEREGALAHLRGMQARWERALRRLTEVAQGVPTHITPSAGRMPRLVTTQVAAAEELVQVLDPRGSSDCTCRRG